MQTGWRTLSKQPKLPEKPQPSFRLMASMPHPIDAVTTANGATTKYRVLLNERAFQKVHISLSEIHCLFWDKVKVFLVI